MRKGRKVEAMGALCCCLSSDAFEDYLPYQNGTFIQDYFCFRCCLPWFSNTRYSTDFGEVDHQDTIFSRQVSTSGGAGTVGGSNLEPTIPDVFQAPPTPLPYDTDPRYPRINRDGLSRRDKSGMSHLNPGGGPTLRPNNSDAGGGTALQRVDYVNSVGVDVEDAESRGLMKPVGLGERNPLSSKPFPRVESALSMLDDDDVCPTCLDGYTEENPRITTGCGHNFHLACIYEWMERSNRCPICDKEMIFSESL